MMLLIENQITFFDVGFREVKLHRKEVSLRPDEVKYMTHFFIRWSRDLRFRDGYGCVQLLC